MRRKTTVWILQAKSKKKIKSDQKTFVTVAESRKLTEIKLKWRDHNVFTARKKKKSDMCS